MPIATINPATAETLKTFDALTGAEIDARIARAALTFRTYRRTPIAERAERMLRAAAILEAEQATFGRMMTTEMGKLVKAGSEEAAKCAWGCRFYAENAARMLADEPVQSTATESFVRYQPLGPILAVMPWNFPFWQVFRLAAPALMAGNVVLLKHASNVPQCALMIEDILRRAGFPDGAFQTLLIGSDQVQRVLDDPRVAGASLTGSEAGGPSGRRRRGPAAQEDGARARRQRSVHRDGERRHGRGDRDGGQGANRQQRAVVHRGETLHRHRGRRRCVRARVYREDAGAQGRRPAGSGDRGRSAGDENRSSPIWTIR